MVQRTVSTVSSCLVSRGLLPFPMQTEPPCASEVASSRRRRERGTGEIEREGEGGRGQNFASDHKSTHRFWLGLVVVVTPRRSAVEGGCLVLAVLEKIETLAYPPFPLAWWHFLVVGRALRTLFCHAVFPKEGRRRRPRRRHRASRRSV